MGAKKLTQSQQATDWIRRESKATGAARTVLLVFGFYTNDATGLTYPSAATVAREANVDRRTVFKAVETLESLGELEAVARHGHAPTEYRVKFSSARGGIRDDASSARGGTREGFSSARGAVSSARGGTQPLEDLYKTPARVASKPTDDPIKARADALAKLAFEQPIKPALRAGRKGAFVAVLGILTKLLEAGNSDSAVEGIIRAAGPKVWTLAGLQMAITKLGPTFGEVSYEDVEIDYSEQPVTYS